MNKLPFVILLAVVAVLAACSKKAVDTGADEDYTENDTVNAFTPVGGMPLSQLCDVPGLSWALDTVYGVCASDSLVLWAVYGDRWLPTTVRGAENDFNGLTEHGIATIKTDPTLSLGAADFNPAARLLSNLAYSRGRMRMDADSLLDKRLAEMMNAATDFFTSYGMTKYMSKNMADKWIRVQNDASANGVEAPNPINGCNIIEFEPGSVAVTVDDARKGDIRVRAYCRDSFTLGRPGWAFWRLKMCREGRYFKVLTPPILIRPGDDAFSQNLYDYSEEEE